VSGPSPFGRWIVRLVPVCRDQIQTGRRDESTPVIPKSPGTVAAPVSTEVITNYGGRRDIVVQRRARSPPVGRRLHGGAVAVTITASAQAADGHVVTIGDGETV